jgi:predicted RNA binding protein YcfA (HicA-like mRNA interferase family)
MFAQLLHRIGFFVQAGAASHQKNASSDHFGACVVSTHSTKQLLLTRFLTLWFYG